MSSSSRLAVGLDLGSSLTRCVICELQEHKLKLLGFSEVPSRGWAKGRMTDPSAASEIIRGAVEEAEKRAQTSVDAAVVGIAGTTVQGSNSRGLYEFGRPREIDPGDLGYAVELASRVRLDDDRLLLQVLPQDFTLDGRAGYRHPKKATCARLEANVHVVTVSAIEHQAVVSAVHQAHLAVEETIFEPIAAAYSCILQEDRGRGVALIDIGAQSTDLVVYDGESLLKAASLAISADHFTRDVAFGFNVNYEDAEKLKREYGCAILGLTSDNSLIEVPSPEGRAPREATRRQLNEILEARAEELFLYVRNELAKVGMEQALLEGVVLTGGGALLNGMCDMAERVLNCQARNGLPVGIEEWPDSINSPTWASVAGLAMYSGKLKLQKEWKRKVPGIMGLVLR
jgi:cell division protein FtsA